MFEHNFKIITTDATIITKIPAPLATNSSKRTLLYINNNYNININNSNIRVNLRTDWNIFVPINKCPNNLIFIELYQTAKLRATLYFLLNSARQLTRLWQLFAPPFSASAESFALPSFSRQDRNERGRRETMQGTKQEEANAREKYRWPSFRDSRLSGGKSARELAGSVSGRGGVARSAREGGCRSRGNTLPTLSPTVSPVPRDVKARRKLVEHRRWEGGGRGRGFAVWSTSRGRYTRKWNGLSASQSYRRRRSTRYTPAQSPIDRTLYETLIVILNFQRT